MPDKVKIPELFSSSLYEDTTPVVVVLLDTE